jgi:hypothetical protein
LFGHQFVELLNHEVEHEGYVTLVVEVLRKLSEMPLSSLLGLNLADELIFDYMIPQLEV